MLRYQNNAFRVLGLQPSVSMHEIIQRVNEIKVKKSLGMDVSYQYDFPWMGALDRSEHNVISALQRLENPILRLKEEIFWFWFETDQDSQAINYLAKNNRQAAHDTWKASVISDIPTKKSISAFVNQGILAHSSVVGKEIGIKYGEETEQIQIKAGEKGSTKYCPKCKKEYDVSWKICADCRSKLKQRSVSKTDKLKKSNITLGDTHWKNWRFVINRFSVIASQDLFWEHVKKKAKKLNDPRLSHAKVNEIRERFVADIAESNFSFISRALSCKDYERVKRHTSLLNGSTVAVDVLREGFNQILSERNRMIARYSELAETNLLKVKNEQKDSAKKFINIYTRLIDNVENVFYEGDMVDINSISNFVIARDKLAKAARNSAIALNNALVSDKLNSQKEIINNYNCAHDMIKKALEFAKSSYIRQKYVKDEELIRKNLELARAYNSYAQQQSPQKTSEFNWKATLGWGAVILFFIIIGNLPDNSSSNKSSARSSSRSTPSTAQTSLSQLNAKIDRLATSIKQRRNRILELEAMLNSKASKLEALKLEIDTLKSRSKSVWIGKDKLLNKYNQKVDQHNYLLKACDRQYNEYKKLYEEVEGDVTIHDNLVKSYNSRIK